MARLASPKSRVPCSAVSGIAACAIALGSVSARAENQFLVAKSNPAEPSSFSLDFGGFGGVSAAEITSTELILSIDLAEETAGFLHYDQKVEPLILPGGFSTGNIRVTIADPSSDGSCDPVDLEFTTTDLYSISFDGDLSAFQIQSPFFLPGTSVGTVAFDEANRGTVSMEWQGQGQLPNPFDPANPIGFTYLCRVETLFVVPAIGDADGDVDGDLRDFSLFQICFSGDGRSFGPARCALVDYDTDGDVDETDLIDLTDNLNGPATQ